jgi:hypothetical protein
MKKVLVALFCSIAEGMVNHPFVGQHADSEVVNHKNGQISLRLKPKVNDSYGKFKHLETETKPHKSVLD